jgi:hypothetical protein
VQLRAIAEEPQHVDEDGFSVELLPEEPGELHEPVLLRGSPATAPLHCAEALQVLEGALPSVRGGLPGYLRHLFLQVHIVTHLSRRDNLEIMYKHLKQERNLLQEKLNENKLILNDINQEISVLNDEEKGEDSNLQDAI